MTREQICSQVPHCLSCPLSVGITGKDCRNLTKKEIDDILFRVKNEGFNGQHPV